MFDLQRRRDQDRTFWRQVIKVREASKPKAVIPMQIVMRWIGRAELPPAMPASVPMHWLPQPTMPYDSR